MSKIPLVSICMITYSHQEYIEHAINGVLMQDCDFEIELIISNDCSPDKTNEIITKIINSHPKSNVIKYYNLNKNIGMMSNFISCLKKAKGKFIALCEGDDYWIDKKKLQRQVDFMNNNSNYSLIAENGLVLNSILNTTYSFSEDNEKDIEIYELLTKRQFPTASVLFKNNDLNGFYELEYKGDTILWCYLATKGKIKYLPNISSVYRRGIHGIVESTKRYEWAKLMESWNITISKIIGVKKYKRLIRLRNYNEFSNVYFSKSKQINNEELIFCFIKCLRYKPTLFIKSLFYIRYKNFISFYE
jgi:glycosyltransferase involved in cell wall biosynthesis